MGNKFRVGDKVIRTKSSTILDDPESQEGFVGTVIKVNECGDVSFDGSIYYFNYVYYELYEESETKPERKHLSLAKINGALALAYDSEILPYQCSLKIQSEPNDVGIITVEFMADGLLDLEDSLGENND